MFELLGVFFSLKFEIIQIHQKQQFLHKYENNEEILEFDEYVCLKMSLKK